MLYLILIDFFDFFFYKIKPGWRNWQTHGTQNPAVVTSCRFESDSRHQAFLSEMTGKPIKNKFSNYEAIFLSQNPKVFMQENCIFCKIIAGTVPAEFIYQDNDLIVIKDIKPDAPIHYLIIPKKHISDINQFKSDDTVLAGKLLMVAQHISTITPGAQAYNLVVNNGAAAGQCVFHVHIHFLAGKKVMHV